MPKVSVSCSVRHEVCATWKGTYDKDDSKVLEDAASSVPSSFQERGCWGDRYLRVHRNGQELLPIQLFCVSLIATVHQAHQAFTPSVDHSD